MKKDTRDRREYRRLNQAHYRELRAANRRGEGYAAYRAWRETYDLANHDRIRSYEAAYRATHRDECRVRTAAYRARRPEVYAHHASKRRAAQAGNGGSHSIEEWDQKCSLLGNVCLYCGLPAKLSRDHKLPISRGGCDSIHNVVPACKSCNSSKRTKTAQEFIAWRGDILRRAAAVPAKGKTWGPIAPSQVKNP